jgi:phosphate-selective porin OprO and OprP
MLGPARFAFRALTIGTFVLAPFAAKTSAAQSDSERLEKLERAVELLQQRNTELEREVSSLKKQKSSTTALTPEKRSKFVTDSKSYGEKSEVTEEKKPIYVVPGTSEIKLTLGGLLQSQYEVGDVSAFEGRFPDGPNEIHDRFRIRRARINITGEFAEQFDFKLEGEYAQSDMGITVRNPNGTTQVSNTTRTAFGGLDLWANWHRFPEFNVKVGQYKAPFGLEQISPDPKLFTLERSQVTSALTPERQIGLQIWGKPLASIFPEQKDLVNYAVGIFNGNGRNITVNDNNEYMYVGRLEVQALKTKAFNEEVWLKLGANALSSRDEAGTVLSPAGNLRVNSDGSLTPYTALSAAEREGYGVDAAFHFGPFDFVAEYLSERYDARPANGVPPLFQDFRADGYYVQGSYFIIPKKLQLFTKYESFNPGQVANDNLSSITGGLNYYIHGDDLKILAHYIHTWSDFRENNPAFGSDEFDEFILRLQVLY